MEIHKYFISYVGRSSQGKVGKFDVGSNVFGNCDVDVKGGLKKDNIMKTVNEIKLSLERETGLKEIIILNFQELTK